MRQSPSEFAASCLARTGQYEPPFDPEAVIRFVRPACRVVRTELPHGVESVTAMLDAGPAIFLSPSLDAAAARMAIAQGIGSVLYDAWTLHQHDQARAEAFALALLVPFDLFRCRLRGMATNIFSLPVSAVEMLSRVFVVPEIVIAARLFDVVTSRMA